VVGRTRAPSEQNEQRTSLGTFSPLDDEDQRALAMARLARRVAGAVASAILLLACITLSFASSADARFEDAFTLDGAVRRRARASIRTRFDSIGRGSAPRLRRPSRHRARPS
jgi:hypothetical protein